MTTKRKDIIDTQIIEGCKAKDAPCQRSLYELTVTKLYNVVYRIVLDRHKTQDVLQEVYINSIAEKFVNEKKMMVRELQQHGILSLLTPPAQLTVHVVNKYLELKSRQAN